MNQHIEISNIAAAQTRHLRGTVLRPGLPIEESVYPHDDDPTTIHVGAVENDRVIGIASFYREAMPTGIDYPQPNGNSGASAWRLRGMAVEPMRQGQGIGFQILRFGISQLAQGGGTLLWCNARTGAVGFYRAAGFATCGDEFMIPGVGPHFVMACSLR